MMRITIPMIRFLNGIPSILPENLTCPGILHFYDGFGQTGWISRPENRSGARFFNDPFQWRTITDQNRLAHGHVLKQFVGDGGVCVFC